MKIISKSLKIKIMYYLKETYSSRLIADKVASVSHMTIARLQKQATLDAPLPKPGCPSMFKDTDKRKIVRDINSGKQLKKTQIRRAPQKSLLKPVK